MKTKAKKILQWIVSTFMALCLVALLALSGTGLYFAKKTSADDSGDYAVSIEAQTATDDIAQPSSDNKVYLTISASVKPAANVRVYYHTINKTASAAMGDYDAVDTSILLTPSNYSQTIAITTYAKGYQTVYSSTQKTRTFTVSIYRIEDDTDSAYISTEKNSVECSAGYNTSLSVSTGYGYRNYEAYHGTYYRAGSYDTPEIDGKHTWTGGKYYVSQLFAEKPTWKTMLDKGIAHLMVRPSGSVYDDNTWEYPGELYISVYKNGVEVLKWTINTDSMSGGSTDYISKYVTSVSIGSGVVMNYSSFAVLENVSANDYFTFVIENPDNSDDVWLYLNYEFHILDYEAPTVVEYSIQDDVKQGEKIGLTMRLSEPVQIFKDNAEKLAITGWVNGMLANSVTFKYMSGSYTDTLYFEADAPSESKLITGIRLSTFSGFNGTIRDFSGRRFTYNESTGEYTYEDSMCNVLKDPEYINVPCNIDLRVPSVSVTEKLSAQAMRRSETTLKLENIGDGARLYYTWTQTDFTPMEYNYSATDLEDTYTVVGSNMNGKRYLHVKVVSDYGKETLFSRGPYLFDNKAPTVTATLSDTSTLKQKDFLVSVTDGETGLCAGVDKVYMLIVATDGSLSIQKALSGASETEKTFSVTASELGLGTDAHGTFNIAFYAVDTIGNQTAESDIVYTTYRFDTRNYFSSSFAKVVDADGNDLLLRTTSDGAYVVNSTKTPIVYIEYSDVNNPSLESFYRPTKDTYSVSVDYKEASEKTYITLSIDDGIAGYAEFYLSATDGGTNKISDTYRFYFTANGAEDTKHYSKVASGTLLMNKVYQLSATTPYAYKDTDGAVCTSLYGGTSLAASFSSSYEAKKYVYYMELQDLYAVQLTQAQANALNEGITTNYIKAKNETITAKEGQIWIRYKSSTFEPSTSPSSNSWVFYYYSAASLTVDTGRLSDNLLDAISSVSARIVSYGSSAYLVGEDNLNSLGEPYLAAAQLHITKESADNSMSGTTFTDAVSYDGDNSIYDWYVSIDGEDYPIATNLALTFGDYTKLYYRSDSTAEYKEILSGAGTYLSDIIKVTGTYQILELDEYGMHVFSVYIDVNAPVVNVLWENSDGASVSADFDESSNGMSYNAKTFVLGSISAQEKDSYAYVAVYRYISSGAGTLLNVYSRDQLSATEIMLDDGNYHIEVADRSGNMYSFVLRINSTGLICSVSEETNVCVRVTCNRESDQIAAYEITCNGTLLTSTYSASAKYTQSGYYEVYIRDIYGNEFTQTLMFERSLPLLTWKYNDNGTYVTYDSETTDMMKITQSDEKTYVITTSTLLQFSFTEEYSFSSDIEWSESLLSHTHTMKTLSTFQLTVWYTAYPEITVVYICAVDTTAPTISARREIETYSPGETDEILKQVKNGGDGDTITISTIGYSKGISSERFVSNGETVQSRFVRISVSDASGVSYIKIYFDGNLYLEEKETFTDIVLSRYGTYKIEAVDIFGNTSSFSFVNQQVQTLEYFVDGIEQDIDYSCLDYFSGSKYTKTEYGNTSAILTLYRDVEIAYKITNGENTIITLLSIENGELCLISYRITTLTNGTKTSEQVKSSALLSTSDASRGVGIWYLVLSEETAGANIYAAYDKNGYFSLKVAADTTGESVYTIESRVWIATDEEPFYYRCALYAGKTDVELLADGTTTIETNHNETQIRINQQFNVSSSCAEDSSVVSVKVYYSTNGIFNSFVVVYNGDYTATTFSAEGMYLVEILNVYGTTTKYYLILSESFVVTVKTQFADGDSITYSSTYDGILQCNEQAIITAYADSATIAITKDGENHEAVVQKTDDAYIITLSGNGVYVVSLTDEYGNEIRREIKILYRDLADDVDLLYGFNEKALKKDEGYTNTLVSVSTEQLEADGLVYVAVQYNNSLTVLYDLLSETKIPLSEKALTECIGLSGDGEYQIIFRDEYGNRIVKTVHYSGTPTLQLSRMTRSSSVQETYNLDTAIEIGLWSNQALYFVSTADEYTFTVDGRSIACPHTIVFGSGAEEGSFTYAITYIDAYGFSYSFTAHLYRQTIELTLSETDTKEIDGVITLRTAFSVDFTDGATGIYTLNSGEQVAYTKGTLVYKDGAYRFVVEDYAGNLAVMAVKKDSAVEFTFTETATDTILVSGAVACTNRVSFATKNSDTTYIEKVYLDGIYQSGYEERYFTESGKWEILLADEAGNHAYFTFYILTHSVKEFAYTTPYNYKITEVWYDAGNGVKVSYMQFVTDEGTACNFAENGTYSVVMSSEVTGGTANFTVTVNNVAPNVTLVGCNDGDTTLNDITIKGYEVGDTVEIYRDGQLMRTIKILTSATEVPAIDEGGDYTIIVRNAAGVETSLSFTRKHIPNTAGNVLIFVLLFSLVAIISVGLIYRNRSKSDD